MQVQVKLIKFNSVHHMHVHNSYISKLEKNISSEVKKASELFQVNIILKLLVWFQKDSYRNFLPLSNFNKLHVLFHKKLKQQLISF